MTDENKSETEVETQDIQEKYDELLEELTLKEEELAKVKDDLEKLKKQYKNNERLYQQKMMALYKKNGYSAFLLVFLP